LHVSRVMWSKVTIIFLLFFLLSIQHSLLIILHSFELFRVIHCLLSRNPSLPFLLNFSLLLH
jgi:hypothetical protein